MQSDGEAAKILAKVQVNRRELEVFEYQMEEHDLDHLQPLQEKDSILGCEAVPPSPRPAGPALRQGGVLVDAYWALSYIADSSDEQRIQVLIFQQAEKPEGR